MPTEKHDSALWIHSARLPLGGGWKGYCTAPGHEGEIPADDQLRHGCNLGYARDCAWCPRDRTWDSVRFGASKECEQRVFLCYACEKDHHPAEHGTLEYDCTLGRWNSSHPDPRVQRMAECYIQAYLSRKSAVNVASSSAQS